MTFFQALILGGFQGIAEFLPISSSGHLLIFKELFNLNDIPLLFDIIIHSATLLSIAVIFRKQIYGIILALYRWITRKNLPEDKENLAIIPLILIATVTTAIIGVLVKKYLPQPGIKVVSAGFIFTSVVLIIISFLKGKKQFKNTKLHEAFFIGVAQGIGVIPGISRSGITISSSVLAGMDRAKAGEFSFLLAFPAVLGALILDIKDLNVMSQSVSPLNLLVASISSFIIGVISLKLLIPIIKKGKLAWFALYLIPVGIISFLFIK